MPPKTPPYAKRWCFTLNNYKDEDIARIKKAVTKNIAKFAVVGKEVAETGTMHLQGFVHFKTRYRMHQVKAIL